MFSVVYVERQVFGSVLVEVLQFRQQAFIRQVQRMRVLPIRVRDFVQAIDHVGIAHLDSAFTPAIKAAGSQVD